MSNDGISRSSHHDNEPRKSSVVADVTFTPVADHDGKRDRPTKASANSFRSEREKWATRGDRLKDHLQTPLKSLSNRKSEDSQQDDDGANGSVQKRVNGGRGSLLEVRSSRSTKSEGKRRAGDTSSSPVAARDGSRASTASYRQSSPTLSRVSDQPPSSRASSSQYAEAPSHGLRTQDHRLSKAPSMDPAQLVQMALNLSESRKRHASNPATLAVPSTQNASRRVSAGLVPSNVVNDEVSVKPPGSRASNQQHALQSELDPVGNDTDQYHFSPATLARAEKARKYFELADKHRRLLAQLPQLPHSKAHGRFRGLSKVDQYNPHEQREHGREYNPLQALRNRRAREQQKDIAVCSAEQFLDVDKVEEWLVKVEATSADRTADSPIQLPAYSPGTDYSSGGTIGHRRAGTADTVIMKPDHDWYISPAELLADTYWTEQRQHQSGSNDRHERTHRDNARPEFDKSQYPPGLSPEEITPEKQRHSHRHFIPLSAANRLRQHRFTKRSASVSSASSTEGRKKLPTDVNIGPLQRHMDEMIRKDAHEEMSAPSKTSPDHWDLARNGHRGHEHQRRRSSIQNGHVVEATTKMNGHADTLKPRVSTSDSSYPASPVADRLSVVVEDDTAHRRQNLMDVEKNRLPLFRGRSKDRRGSSILDFAHQEEPKQEHDDGIDPSRLSVEGARPATFHRHKTADSISSSIRDLVHVRSKTDGGDMTAKEPSSAVTRFLRGGRFGDMVRTESSKFGNKLRGRERAGEEIPSDASAINSEASDVEGTPADLQRGPTSADASDASPRTSLDQIRKRPRYQIPHLPSFRSTPARDQAKLQSTRSDNGDDHISRQQAALRKRNRSPRFERLAPPRINLPEGEDDPNHLRIPTDKSSTFDERRRSYGFLNPALRDRSRSISRHRPFLARGRSGGPTSSSALETIPTRSTGDSRHWSITNQRPPGIFSEKNHGVTARDVARVRALLLASGIKAREISRRLEVPSAILPNYLLQSARLCEIPSDALHKRPRRQEYTYAVELLSTFVDNALGTLGKEIEVFQSKNLQALITRQDQLKARVADDLTELVHSASDQADAFNIELSTQATLRTKQVDDAVDAVLRLRRRQFRLLRLAAFKLLEWITLSILWWLWFVVVCFKTVQRVVLGIFRLLRWLFTF